MDYRSRNKEMVEFSSDEKEKLATIFQYYSNFGEAQINGSLSFAQFLHFCQSARLFIRQVNTDGEPMTPTSIHEDHGLRFDVPLFENDILEVFQKSIGNNQQASANTVVLNFKQFLIAVGLLIIRKCITTDQFMGTFILPLFSKIQKYLDDNPEFIRQSTTLSLPDVRRVFEHFEGPLHHVYRFYAEQDENRGTQHVTNIRQSGPAKETSMSWNECLSFFSAFRIYPILIPHEHMTQIFRASNFGDDADGNASSLSFLEFVQCIGRCALFLYETDDLTPAEKIERFMAHIEHAFETVFSRSSWAQCMQKHEEENDHSSFRIRTITDDDSYNLDMVDKYQLQIISSSDGQQFLVDRDVIMLSTFFRTLFTEKAENLPGVPFLIEFMSIRGSTLEICLQYLYYKYRFDRIDPADRPPFDVDPAAAMDVAVAATMLGT